MENSNGIKMKFQKFTCIYQIIPKNMYRLSFTPYIIKPIAYDSINIEILLEFFKCCYCEFTKLKFTK